MLIFLRSKDMLYQVSTDLGELNSFYSSFSDASQKAPFYFSKVQKGLPGIDLKDLFMIFQSIDQCY